MRILESMIGLLSPADCIVCGGEGSLFCRNCAASTIKPFGERCWRCNSLSAGSKTCPKCRSFAPLANVYICTSYEAKALELVQRYKFGHARPAAEPLARMMAETLLTINRPQPLLVVPVPTATSRVRQRGFDHSQLLAKLVAGNLGLEYSNSLRRIDQTRQLGSKREDRLAQLANSFSLKSYHSVAGQNILVIDDVLTTGGTLSSVAKVLKSAGAKQVSALIFAKRL